MTPVVSIGNLAMGGRGKTPVTALVARLLVAAGERPAILSRGYKRRRPAEGVVVVSDGERVRAHVDESGDEPLVLARHVPGARVLVGEVRAVAAALAERAFGATVHVLDDGFQHWSLARHVDIVLVTPDDLSSRRVPFGRLRSSVSSLAGADAIVIDGPDEPARDRLTHVLRPGVPVFTLRRALGQPVAMAAAQSWPAGRARVVAAAGIARPERFFDMLRVDGWDVADALPFRDHHRYRARDVVRLSEAVTASGAFGVVTTEKDAVRLEPLGPLPVPVAAVPLEVEVDPPEAFRDWLLARLREVRA